MKKYIVGGFCRDRLMGLTPKDKDYVIVGATPKDIIYLESIGYKQVGADFPVYISPDGDEYALARTERKTGTGYDGFTVKTSGVTLEQDLSRRDLTINAIAFDPVRREHVDPYNGKLDLKNKVLKHVSDAFKEDPLRVLRLARFATRYSDFTIHPDTDAMVRAMVAGGEIDHLTSERVYVEFEKAFSEEKPVIFLKYLKDIGALKILLPEFKCTQKELDVIDCISKNSSLKYKEEFIWSIILNTCENTLNKKSHVVGHIKLPSRITKFSTYVKDHSDNIMLFRKKNIEDMVDTFNLMSIKNNGGEEFLYKVTEYFILRKEIDYELEDFIVKVYDTYFNTEIGDIEQMIKDGELKNSEIKDFVRNKLILSVNSMFSKTLNS